MTIYFKSLLVLINLYSSITFSYTRFSNSFRRSRLFQSNHNNNNNNLLEIQFNYPSGLLFTPNIGDDIIHDNIFCLIKHNIVKLRPEEQKVNYIYNALSNTICDDLIETCAKYALANDGWTSARHSSYPTTDLPLTAVLGWFIFDLVLPYFHLIFLLNYIRIRPILSYTWSCNCYTLT